jgi:thiamine monophosphate kinase
LENMSRSGYSDDCCDDQWQMIMYRGAVKSAFKGKRGQAFFREMLAALDALPQPMLISGDLERGGAVCAIGAVGNARGIDMSGIDPEDAETVAGKFGVATCMAREIVYENDEYYRNESPLARWVRVRRWVKSQIRESVLP